MNFFERLLDLLYPRRCLSCGRFGEYICDPCALKIQFIETNICPICRKPAIGGRTHPRCRTKYTLDGLTSIFAYKDPVRKAIKRVKYKPFAYDVSKTLVSLALERTDQERTFFSSLNRVINKKPVFISIPLHRSRERKRGFNQAEVLGKIFAGEWGLPFNSNLLIRQKKTEPQYKLEGEERKLNVQKAFEIHSQFLPAGRHSAIRNSRIILFDDVWTTGATMRTCGNILKRAGVKFVWGLTLAR